MLQRLVEQGFDQSAAGGASTYQVSCSQCAALVINGVPAHERGCRNATASCGWCGGQAPAGSRFCDESCNAAYHGLQFEEHEPKTTIVQDGLPA